MQEIAMERNQMLDASKVLDMARASSVPHMKEKDRKEFYKQLQRVIVPPSVPKAPDPDAMREGLEQLKGKLL